MDDQDLACLRTSDANTLPYSIQEAATAANVPVHFEPLIGAEESVMSVETIQELKMSAHPSVSDVLDQACLDEGMSVQELEINKRLADIFDRLLASGRTVEDINAEWECETQQEILRQYENFTPTNL